MHEHCHPIRTELCKKCNATIRTIWSCGWDEVRRSERMGHPRGLHHDDCDGKHGTYKVEQTKFYNIVRSRQAFNHDKK